MGFFVYIKYRYNSACLKQQTHNMNLPRYKELDALRGFAAVFVLIFHYTYATRYELPWLTLGVTGVDLFFIISGFVIFMSIQSVSSVKEFLINRFARLFPTYWTCVTFTTCAILLFGYVNSGQSVTAYQYMANMTMFQHYLRAENIDGTYWTMTIEMVFYISIAVLYRMNQLKNIIPIGLAVIGCCLIWDVFIEEQMLTLYKVIRYVFPLIAHFPLFFAGILFYRIITANGHNMTNYLLLLLCLPAQILLYNNGGSAHRYISHGSYAIMLCIYFGVFILFVNARLGFIVTKPALFAGKISYALYLIHQYVSIDLIIPRLEAAGVNYFAAAAIAFVVSVTLAWMITSYIENPLRKRIRTFALKQKTLSAVWIKPS